jgi:hypothetical protein
LFVVLLAALAATAGCSTVPREESVELRLSLDADSYQIGEPVRATLQVKNKSHEALFVPALDDSTLTFYWGEPGTGVRMKRRPVLPKQAPGRPRSVGPEESEWRTFLFTRLTPEAGQWGLMAALAGCRLGSETAKPLTTFYSEPVAYQVSETVRFERDRYSGIITAEQAGALVKEQGHIALDTPVRTVLVPLGDSELYVWTVFPLDEAGEPATDAGFTVNPYSGVVKPLELNEPLQEGNKE